MPKYHITYIDYKGVSGESYVRASSKSEALRCDILKSFGIKKVLTIKEQEDGNNN